MCIFTTKINTDDLIAILSLSVIAANLTYVFIIRESISAFIGFSKWGLTLISAYNYHIQDLRWPMQMRLFYRDGVLYNSTTCRHNR